MTEDEKNKVRSAWKLVEKLAAEVNGLQIFGQKLLQDKYADEKEVTTGQIYNLIDRANKLQTFAMSLDSAMSCIMENKVDNEEKIMGLDITFHPSGRRVNFCRYEENEND